MQSSCFADAFPCAFIWLFIFYLYVELCNVWVPHLVIFLHCYEKLVRLNFQNPLNNWHHLLLGLTLLSKVFEFCENGEIYFVLFHDCSADSSSNNLSLRALPTVIKCNKLQWKAKKRVKLKLMETVYKNQASKFESQRVSLLPDKLLAGITRLKSSTVPSTALVYSICTTLVYLRGLRN